MSGTLLDTSVWVRYFRPGGDEALKAEVSRLLALGEVFTCWVVKAELLVGTRDEGAFDRLLSALEGLPEVELTAGVWESAARLGHRLRRLGISIPLPDLLIAGAALSADLELWHTDEDFERVKAAAPLKTRFFPAEAGG